MYQFLRFKLRHWGEACLYGIVKYMERIQDCIAMRRSWQGHQATTVAKFWRMHAMISTRLQGAD